MNSLNKALQRMRREGIKQWTRKLNSIFRFSCHIRLTRLRNQVLGMIPKKLPVHFGVSGYKNAGDTSLFREVERAFDQRFTRRDLHWGEVLPPEMDRMNRTNAYLVLGGGGLFIKDTNTNQNSNWQFDIRMEVLEELKIPLIIFAVGYNRFREQDDFGDLFKAHLIRTIEKACFVGIRNHGSMKALKEYLPESLWPKLVYQPCPTTIIRYHHPQLIKALDLNRRKNRIIAVNMAFDRPQKRFGGKTDSVMESMLDYAETMKAKGWQVIFVGHTGVDRNVCPFIEHRYPYKDLTTASEQTILRFYSRIPITIGMRGHAQMIPFGLGNPIISLISHNKLRWFLEDIGHPEWGIDLNETGLTNSLLDKTVEIVSHFDDVRTQISEAQIRLKSITDTNIQSIRDMLKTS